METRTIDCDGISVEVCRMRPPTMLAFSAAYQKSPAQESGIDRAERGKRLVAWLKTDPEAHQLLFERVIPECVLSLTVNAGTDEERTWKQSVGGKPTRGQAKREACVTAEPGDDDSKFYLGDFGTARIVSLAIDLMSYTQEADEFFRPEGDPAAETVDSVSPGAS